MEETETTEEVTWSTTREQIINFEYNYLKEQIIARYGFFDRPTSGLSNVVMDTFFPRMYYREDCSLRHVSNSANIPSTAVAISPLIANALHIKQLKIDQLIRILGYNEKVIKKILLGVKAKKLHMVFVGVGGTGMNTLHWITELAELTNTVNLFERVTLYDDESMEISNLLRMPIDINTFVPHTTALNSRHIFANKAFIGYKYAKKLGRNIPHIRRKKLEVPTDPVMYPISETDVLLYKSVEVELNYEPEEESGSERDSIPHRTRRMYQAEPNPNVVLYGAPDIESRSTLSKIGNFISGTHSGNSCSLWLNPHQDSSMQVETYGSIQLSSFFMNQLSMAIELLKFLSEIEEGWGDPSKEESNDIELFNYSFDGEIKSKTDRNYHFQIDDNLLMMTEDEAMEDN